MADKEKNVVLNFKMDGQVKYAETLREINSVMNTAAKEYKNHIAAMGNDADATDKLRAEKKKLEIQMEGAQKRTKMLSAQYEAMSKDTKTTTGQLTQMYGKLLDAEKAETSLQKSLDRVNDGLSDQAQEARDAQKTLDDLKNESGLLEAEQNKLTSEYKLQTAEMGDNASEADKVAAAQKQVASQMNLAERAVQNMEKQLDATKTAYGENSTEVMQLETRLNGARTDIVKFNKELEGVEDSGQKAEKGLDGVNGGLQALAGAAGIAAVGGLVEGMQETNQQLAMLEMQAVQTNLSMSDFEGARNNFVSVGQDVGQAVEAMGNLTQAGYKTKESLDEISVGIAGAIVKYGETFTSEGLAESINSTAQLGEVTGQLTDLLEKEGVSVEDFNEKIAGMADAEERANFISQALTDQGLNGMYEKYVEMNPEVVKNAESQASFQETLAELAVILTPLVTQVTDFTKKLIEWANENPRLTLGITVIATAIGALTVAAAILAPIITAIGVASGGAAIGIGALMTTLLPIIAIIAGVALAIAGIVLAIQNWGAITDWLGEKWSQFVTWIKEILENLKTIFFAALDWIDEKTNGKFSNVINTIKKYMNMGLENVQRIIKFIEDSFKNGLDFITALVSGDFAGMFKAVKNQMGNIEDTVGDVWGNVMDFFRGIDLWEIGKEIIGGFIRGFKSLKIPTPKFSITGDLDLNPVGGISVPKVSVKWNAIGGIFKKPTIFGASGGQLQGAGEAGPEAVLPLNSKTLGAIGEAIAATMGKGNTTKQPQIIQLVTPDSRVLAEMVVDEVTEIQDFKTDRDNSFK